MSAVLGAFCTLQSADWPQFRGPNHDGVSNDRILKQWPTNGLRQMWRVGLGKGFSSFAVSQGQAYTLAIRSFEGTNNETCVALDAETGAELWATPLGLANYPNGQAGPGDGPRSTPTIDGDRVYTLSAYVSLACLDAGTGEVIWSKDLLAEYGGEIIQWESAASALIDGDLIFVNCNAPGQTLIALNKVDGSLTWAAHDDRMAHATPIAATILGQRQIIFSTQSGMIAVEPQSGAELWRFDFGYFNGGNAASPLVVGDMVYFSAGYVGSACVRISKLNETFVVTELWRTTRPNQRMNQWSTPVYVDGYIYGFCGEIWGFGPTTSMATKFKCLDFATGDEKWSVSGLGSGGVLLVDGKILVLSEPGDLVLIEPNPTAYTELARCTVLPGYCWNSPAICDGRIYARSTVDAVCLDASVPALRMLSPERSPAGQLHLVVGTADGSALDSNRAARVEVRGSTNGLTSVADWPPLTNDALLTNGRLRLENVRDASGHRQFIAVEPP